MNELANYAFVVNPIFFVTIMYIYLFIEISHRIKLLEKYFSINYLNKLFFYSFDLIALT